MSPAPARPVVASHRRALLTVAALAAGCATRPGVARTPPPPSPVAASDPGLATSERVLGLFAGGDLEGARAVFGPQMRAGLSLEALRQVWEAIVEEHGRLLSWTVVERQSDGTDDVLVLGLRFERGAMIGIVSVAAGATELRGLYFKEPPGATASGVSRRDVTFGEAPFVLGGTLTGPAKNGAAGAPAALLIGGSGPNDRDETVGPLKPFKDLAEGLARRGIVTLRYDKRTFSHAALCPVHGATVDAEIIDDAVRAVELLRRAPGVDPARVYLVGHSLGALLLPEIAARAGHVAGLVMVAPPGRPLPEIALEQLRSKRVPGAEALAEQWRRSSQLPPDTLWMGAPISYWKDLDARDEFAIARRLDLPTLLVRGDRDRNVAAVDLTNWVHALAPARTCVVKVPNVNHFLVTVDANDQVTSTTASGAVTGSIADFVLSPRTGPDCPAVSALP